MKEKKKMPLNGKKGCKFSSRITFISLLTDIRYYMKNRHLSHEYNVFNITFGNTRYRIFYLFERHAQKCLSKHLDCNIDTLILEIEEKNENRFCVTLIVIDA